MKIYVLKNNYEEVLSVYSANDDIVVPKKLPKGYYLEELFPSYAKDSDQLKLMIDEEIKYEEGD